MKLVFFPSLRDWGFRIGAKLLTFRIGISVIEIAIIETKQKLYGSKHKIRSSDKWMFNSLKLYIWSNYT